MGQYSLTLLLIERCLQITEVEAMETNTSVEEAVATQIEPLIVMCKYFGWDAPQAHLIAARKHLLTQAGIHPFNQASTDEGGIAGLLLIDHPKP